MSKSAVTKKIYELAQRPGGVSTSEAAAVLGMTPRLVWKYMGWMADSGRVQRRDVREGRVRSRVYADPKRSLAAVEGEIKQRIREEARARIAKYDRIAKVRGQATASGSPATRVEIRIVDGRRQRVTVCESIADSRFSADPSAMAPVFSCLGFGRYLDRDTAIQRAYGRRP